MVFLCVLCYYYNGVCDMGIDIINEENLKKGFDWKKFFLIICSIILFISLFVVYSRYKATSGLKIKEYKITDSSLPSSFHGVKVVHFSDVFFGNTVDIKYLNSIISKINELDPDIVVFTGDFIDKNIDNDLVESIGSSLNSINSNIGKYAIKGDSDNDLFGKIFTDGGFTILNNSSAKVYYKDDVPIEISNDDIDSDLYRIVLIHKPDDVDSFSSSYNLALAGHSLNGQINIPFVKNLFLRDGCKKYYNEYYNSKSLYISSGIGTTNFKYRLNNRPSINLYRLTSY